MHFYSTLVIMYQDNVPYCGQKHIQPEYQDTLAQQAHNNQNGTPPACNKLLSELHGVEGSLHHSDR